MPVIIGALGTVSKDIEKWLAEIGVTCRLESLQTACLLCTARILRKVQSWTPKVTGGDLMLKEDFATKRKNDHVQVKFSSTGFSCTILNLEIRHLSHLLFVVAKDFLSLSQPSGYAPSVMAL